MRSSMFALAAAALLVTACGDKQPKPDAAPAQPAAAPSGPITPCATCKVIEIGMVTTEKGNYFEPKDLEAHQGDVLRYKLVIGVHNVTFLPDSNPGKTGLPATTPLLQLPGQTSDILVNMAPGKYFFQCDAHAALSMVGTLKVEAKE